MLPSEETQQLEKFSRNRHEGSGFLVQWNLTTSSTPERPEEGGMELNITAGVFMVLMIAIVTALLLCCCKTYVVCQKRRRRQRAWERNNGGTERGNRSLPTTQRYSDEPPTYADIFFSRSAEQSHEAETPTVTATTISNNNTQPKDPEDSIAVYWSFDDINISTEAPPPLYPTVVIENEAAISELPPPGYETCSRNRVRAPPSGTSTRRASGRLNIVSNAVMNAIQSVSALVSKENRRTVTNQRAQRSENSVNESTSHTVGPQTSSTPDTVPSVEYSNALTDV
ncbi:uncharacterized protein LOC100185949 [Ciona intestinalis]